MFVIEDKLVNYILRQRNGCLLQLITELPNTNSVGIDNVDTDYFWWFKKIVMQKKVW